MTHALSTWWRSRTRREQMLVLSAAMLIAVLFAWFAVARPLGLVSEAGRQRYERSMASLGAARAAALHSRRLPAAATPVHSGPIEPIIAAAAAEAGFADAEVSAAGPGCASMRIAAVRPQALLDWLSRIEARGIRIAALRAVPNTDRTVAVTVAFEARIGR